MTWITLDVISVANLSRVDKGAIIVRMIRWARTTLSSWC